MSYPLWSGRPDLNRGPLRPERSALPGCATPRTPRAIGRDRTGDLFLTKEVLYH